MNSGRSDATAGGTLLLLTVALWFLIPQQIGTFSGDALSSASLPRFVIGVLIVLSAALAGQGLFKMRREGVAISAEAEARTTLLVGLGHAAGVLVVALVYVAAIPTGGYLLATGIAFVPLALLYGNRSWRQIVVAAVVLPPLLFFFFRFTMLVLLPKGTLFS